MAERGLSPDHLYRAVDSNRNTIDFLLSPNRDLTAAKHFLQLALWRTREVQPRVINVDGHPAYARAIAELKSSGELGRRCRCRPSPYMNNIVEQDHRFIKKRIAVHGKGNRVRTVPMPAWAKVAIDNWATAAGLTSGRVFRSMNNKKKIVGEVLLPQNIMEAVLKYGNKIGVPNLAPHDLRRTFAKLAHKGRCALEQIQISLGHASFVTTERYLGVRQDLQDAPCDHLGIHI
jgi:integrase